MLQNFILLSTWTDSAQTSSFVEGWTVFYWAWWLALGPYMGIFIAKISRGRTIRQVVLGCIGYGTLGSAAFFAILGNYAVYLEFNDLLPVVEILEAGGGDAAIEFLIRHEDLWSSWVSADAASKIKAAL